MDISALYKCFTECGKVTTDSRNCPEGSMFIALKGETFNGNAYALQALEKGCQYAVVDEKDIINRTPLHTSGLHPHGKCPRTPHNRDDSD
jgi:UDP-N-acetylmuramyl pentapeptide synthase